MVEINLLSQLPFDDLKRVISGYVSHHKYVIGKTEAADQTVISVHLAGLDRPYVKRYDHLDAETLARYSQVLKHELSFGAYDDGRLVGMVLAEPYQWNNSLWVHEFHVAETYRGQGIGRQLMEFLAKTGKAAGLRTIVCETQNTNVPAIRFYRRLGFTLEGIDLSYYTNDDWPDGEIAVFMKKRLC
jgi:ribosomal protein S18 acetylase RimI-like enzyme